MFFLFAITWHSTFAIYILSFSSEIRYQDSVSDWSNMSTCRLLFQWASTIKIQLSVLVLYKADIIIISSNVTRFRHGRTEKLFIWQQSLTSLWSYPILRKKTVHTIYICFNIYIFLCLQFVNCCFSWFKENRCCWPGNHCR